MEKRVLSALVLGIFGFYYIAGNALYLRNAPRHSKNATVWISMGLCWDKNAKIYGKQAFPYKHAAKRSISLWHELTDARVILQIVHTSNITKELIEYRHELAQLGATVFFNQTEENMSCVLTSQVIRMLAYSLAVVEDEDIVVTADVDAFISSHLILKPLTVRNKDIWIWQYELSAIWGWDFALSFIGAKSWVWRKIINYDGSISKMVQLYQQLFQKNTAKSQKTRVTYSAEREGVPPDLEPDELETAAKKWSMDQLIVSHSILDSGLCSLAANNTLWTKVNLVPTQQNAERDVCWKGLKKDWTNCNRGVEKTRIDSDKCKWWHFYPFEGVKHLDRNYREILRSRNDTYISKVKQKKKS